MILRIAIVVGLSLTPLLTPLPTSRLLAAEVDVAALVKQINAVGSKGAGNRQAATAWQSLVKADGKQLPDVLAGMDKSDRLATNWLRSAAETIAQRTTEAGEALPLEALEKFLADRRHAPRARRLAYELIVAANPNSAKRLIPGFLDDPSLELRREAVAETLDKARQLQEDGNKSAAIAAYRRALDAGRDVDQVNTCAKQLKELGQAVNLPRHFGFLMRWHLIASFDNEGMKGFDVVYPPEKAIDLTASYRGKDKEVGWIKTTTEDPYGTVDLNKVIGKHKGAIAYAYAEFVAEEAREVDLRLGCINANKVWLNGDLIISNEVYHANQQIDQYIGTGKLKKGKNAILLKVAQNEQEDPWAQNWQFQLRVCDQFGTAVLSLDRPAEQTAQAR